MDFPWISQGFPSWFAVSAILPASRAAAPNLWGLRWRWWDTQPELRRVGGGTEIKLSKKDEYTEYTEYGNKTSGCRPKNQN